MKLLQENRANRGLEFVPGETALLVAHWQNDVIDESRPFGAMFGPQIRKRGTLQRMQAAIHAARNAGVHVLYLNVVLDPLPSEKGIYDPLMIAASRTRVVVGIAEESGDTFTGRTARGLAERLGVAA